MAFAAPVADIAFWLRKVAGLDEDLAAGVFPDLSPDLVDAVLAEAGRFATEEIAPLNVLGDREGARFENGAVTMPAAWKPVFERWVEGGWTALDGDPEYGGQGLPVMLYAATLEMWNAASTAFATGPMLTAGAVEALSAHGSAEQKATYLPKLIAGTWTGTMNLTESQAGSDLGPMRTRAEPAGDGSYRITGQKIFITYGDHDLTDNIVHLVLARLPDAPAGTRGISLFVVPKFLVEADGSLCVRNSAGPVGIEHKLGIHASPTCVMQFDGAVGWLVGEPNRGLAAMFTMMNSARMSVGVQGVGVAERAYQRALAYAIDRRQGRAPGWTGEGMSPIVHHPDVKRMLLTMRALTDVSRALCLCLARAIDRGRTGPEEARASFAERAALLTPIAKAFATDTGVEVASLGVQVHGGMGYIEETGAAQHLRDARITTIYEGTTAIQANDLINRKILRDKGAFAHTLLAEIASLAAELSAGKTAAFQSLGARLAEGAACAARVTNWLVGPASDDPRLPAAAAAPTLELFGIVVGGHQLALAAKAAEKAIAEGRDHDGFYAAKLATAHFYAEHTLPHAGAL